MLIIAEDSGYSNEIAIRSGTVGRPFMAAVDLKKSQTAGMNPRPTEDASDVVARDGQG
jgi:hypothetical protein